MPVRATPSPAAVDHQAAASVSAQTVFRLIYRSRSRLSQTDADGALGEILRVARARNSAQGVSGALMLYGGWFAQALEGDEAVVRKLLVAITADPRHSSLEVTEQGVVDERAFGRWAMADVGEHGHPDVPRVATERGTTEAAPWRLNPTQEAVVAKLRDLTRGYGIGA